METLSYFNKQKSPQKEICIKLREIILRHYPHAEEEMKWGVPAYAGGKIYIVALKNHVNIGFSLKDLPDDKQHFLGGSGKTMKHLEFHSMDEIKEDIIVDLVNSLVQPV